MRFLPFSFVVCVILIAGRASAALQLSVTPDGTCAVSVDGKRLVDGAFTLQYYRPATLPDDQLDPGKPTQTTATQTAPGHATVVTNYAELTITTEYTLAGEDLTLSSRIENKSTSRTLTPVNFAGPTIHFADHPTGTMPSWHYTYLAAHTRDQIYHPSNQTPCGCVYLTDGKFAVSEFSESEFDHQSLILAGWEKDGVIPADCNTGFFTDRTVPPGKSITVDLSLRVTVDRLIPHLLESYRDVYRKHFPKLLYEPDPRVLLQYASSAQAHVTADNPFGYDGAFRRFDFANGVLSYGRLVLGPARQADVLGVIFWDPGGLRPVMYPPDFDVFPAQVQPNIAILLDACKSRGLRMGLCARCGDGVRYNADHAPEVYRLSPDNPDDMKTVLARFKHATDMGFDIFYLDSFGAGGLNDLAMLKKYREALGPHVLLYTETTTDMSLPYSGAYAEWMGQSTIWLSGEMYDSLRFVCPDSTWQVISRTPQPIPPEFAKLGMTPLVHDSKVRNVPVGWPPKP